MYDTKLISREDIAKYKQISSSSNDDKLNQSIVEAQLENIKPLLGESLFNAVLIEALAGGNLYAELLKGGSYNVNGCDYYNVGLKAVIVYYTSARYTMGGDVIDNPFGLTQKLNSPNSQPIDYPTKKSLSNQDRDFAYNLWLDVKAFLIRTKEPLFNCGVTTTPRKFKIDKIG